MKENSKILIVGSGKAGLGLITPIFQEAGYNVFNTDHNEKTLNSISNGYIIKTPEKELKIDTNCITMEDVSDDFDLIITSVGRKNIKNVSDWYKNKKLSSPIILAENLQNPISYFPKTIPIFIDRICSRVFLDSEIPIITTEEYRKVITLDNLKIKDKDIYGLYFSDSEEFIKKEIKKKLITINLSHVITSLYGEELGFNFIEEAIISDKVLFEVESCLKEINNILNLNQKDFEDLFSNIKERLSSPIKDPIIRIINKSKYKSALNYIENPINVLKEKRAEFNHLKKAHNILSKKIEDAI